MQALAKPPPLPPLLARRQRAEELSDRNPAELGNVAVVRPPPPFPPPRVSGARACPDPRGGAGSAAGPRRAVRLLPPSAQDGPGGRQVDRLPALPSPAAAGTAPCAFWGVGGGLRFPPPQRIPPKMMAAGRTGPRRGDAPLRRRGPAGGRQQAPARPPLPAGGSCVPHPGWGRDRGPVPTPLVRGGAEGGAPHAARWRDRAPGGRPCAAVPSRRRNSRGARLGKGGRCRDPVPGPPAAPRSAASTPGPATTYAGGPPPSRPRSPRRRLSLPRNGPATEPSPRNPAAPDRPCHRAPPPRRRPPALTCRAAPPRPRAVSARPPSPGTFKNFEFGIQNGAGQSGAAGGATRPIGRRAEGGGQSEKPRAEPPRLAFSLLGRQRAR